MSSASGTDRGRGLLICGPLAAATYLCADLIASATYDGYSYLDQTVSELFAIGAPSRTLILVSFSIHNALLAAFGFGVLGAAAGRRLLVVTGTLLIISALLGVVTDFLFPIHQRGVEGTFTDTMHAVLTGVQVFAIFAMVGSSAAAFPGIFRRYAVATILFLLVGGVLAGIAGGDLAAGEETPWMGATERLLIYAYLVWLVVLALTLLRSYEPVAEPG